MVKFIMIVIFFLKLCFCNKDIEVDWRYYFCFGVMYVCWIDLIFMLRVRIVLLYVIELKNII